METTKLEASKSCAILLSGVIFNFITGKVHTSNALWNEMKKQKIGCQADSTRIFQYFKDKNLIIREKDYARNCYTNYKWNGKVNEWVNNVDSRNELIYEMLEFGDIIKKRGRIKGKKYPSKVVKSEPITEVHIQSLSDYSDKMLVEELRNRGWNVIATKEL